MKKFFAFLFFSIFFVNTLFCIPLKPVYYKIDLKKEIGSTTWIYVKKGFQEAQKMNAKGIIIHMNTYGGLVVYADSIRTTILNSPIPVYAFIDNNAASAGALIAIACDSIYMRPGSQIGAATVVNESGEKMPDKYQSYMRATIRSTAESHGADTIIRANGDTTIQWKRDPLIAEAMVDERVVVPNLCDSGKILTFTANEALKYNYAEGLVNSVDELIGKKLKQEQYVIEEFKPSIMDNMLGFLSNPAFQAILIMLIMAGIYFELQSPGLGFPSAAALVAATLYFAPLYLEGLAAHWEILVFVLGVGLLIVELLIIPGFGVTGVLGTICIIAALILALVNNINFDFSPVSPEMFNRSILTVVSGIACGFMLLIYLSHKIGVKGIFYKIALHSHQDNADGYVGIDTTIYTTVGKNGHTLTILRPSGKVEIEGEEYDAVAEVGYIERGETIEVVRTENNQLYVKKIKIEIEKE